MAGEKILVVDDQYDILVLCQRILEVKGYQVQVASDGFEAIQRVQREAFDLLLTDIKLPGITGLEIAKAAKESDPNIVCVTMTGHGTIDLVIEAVKLDVDDFIIKPFTPKDLATAISKALEKQRLKRENVRLRSLVPLFELNRTLLGTFDVPQLAQQLLDIVQEETQAPLVALFIFREEDMFTVHSDGVSTAALLSFRHLARNLQRNPQQLSLSAAQDGEHTDNAPSLSLGTLTLQSLIATPLQTQAGILGVLIAAHKTNQFQQGDREFLSVLCGQACVALQNARLFATLEQNYEELKKLDHMKSEFVNIAAHELRTPLTILMGYTTILDDIATDEQREFINPVIRNAVRLRSLIDDMLNLKYLETGMPHIRHDPVNLRDLVTVIIQDMSLSIREKRVTVDVDLPDDFPIIIADQQKLDLVLVNLFDNAVKFNRQGGKIWFSAQIKDGQAVMSMQDTGMGIPHDKIADIFKPFYQAEESLTREHGGIGLGLAIVRAMLEVCGGTIAVTSLEGRGSTFTLTLPVDNTDLERRPLRIADK